MSWLLAGVLVAALLIYALARQLTRHADGIHRYYLAALSACLVYDDENARLAALTAAKVAAGAQRQSMIAALERSVSVLVAEAGMQRDVLLERGRHFEAEIGDREWPLKEVTRAKVELTRTDPDYARGLERADPTVFVRRYPDMRSVYHKS